MNNRFRVYTGKYLLLKLLVLLFIFGNVVNAQSGRRGAIPTKKTTERETVPTEPKPEKTKPAEIKPMFKLKVFHDTNSLALSRFFFRDKFAIWLVNRLKNAQLLDVTLEKSVNLSEAKKNAKNTTDDVLTVFLELNEDQFISPSQSRSDAISGNISLKYYLFEPGSTKSKHSGQIFLYPEMLRTSSGIMDARRQCYPDINGNDILLLISTIQAAERLMENLKIPAPPFSCVNR